MNDLTRIETGVESPARFTIDEFMQLDDSGVFLVDFGQPIAVPATNRSIVIA